MPPGNIIEYIRAHKIGTEEGIHKFFHDLLRGAGLLATNAIKQPIEELPKYTGQYDMIDLIIKHRMEHEH